jgi:hypothetical protein
MLMVHSFSPACQRLPARGTGRGRPAPGKGRWSGSTAASCLPNRLLALRQIADRLRLADRLADCLNYPEHRNGIGTVWRLNQHPNGTPGSASKKDSFEVRPEVGHSPRRSWPGLRSRGERYGSSPCGLAGGSFPWRMARASP